MNFTNGAHTPATPHRRRPKHPRRRNYGPPATPRSQWKFDDDNHRASGVFQRPRVEVSSRKLAAGLWQLRFTEVSAGCSGGIVGATCDRVGSEPGIGNIRITFPHHQKSRDYGTETKDLLQGALSVSRPKNGIVYKVESSFPYTKYSMEEATKWDRCSKSSDEVYKFYSHMKLLEDQKVATVSIDSTLQAELLHAQSRICQLEAEKQSLKKKVENYLRKVEEERISWQNREHAKIRAVDDLKAEIGRERKSCQRMEIINTKLVNELADAKLCAKQIMQNYEEEKSGRELMEEICNELAKQIGEDKAKVEALKRASMKIREEVEEERNMLQIAEVWREERVHMKLVDAKLALEDRYCQMNKLIADLEVFLRSQSSTLDVMELRKAELIQQAVKSVNIQGIKEFSYMPQKSDDIFSIFEDLRKGEVNKDIEPCVKYSPTCHSSRIHTVSPNVKASSKNSVPKHPNHAIDCNSGCGLEEDTRGWETVSHAEVQGSTYSLEGSGASLNRVSQGKKISDCDENGDQKSLNTEIGEVCLLSAKQSKHKASPVSELWRSCPSNGEFQKIMLDEDNGRLSNGTVSSVGTASPYRESGKGGLGCQDSVAQRSADSANPHITRGMKGCIEWPRVIQKHGLKAKLLEVRMESQKSQLRQFLKQRLG